MKTELKYLSVLLLFFGLSLSLLLGLSKKYTAFDMENIIETCRAAITSVSSLGIHSLGMFLFGLMWLIALIFLSKLFFNLLKTKKKFDELSSLKANIYPAKLLGIIKHHKLSKREFLVVNAKNDTAFTIGVFSPKVVVSSLLIDKFTQDELESIVLHEIYHKQNWHGLILVLGNLVSSSLFFLPVIYELVNKMKNSFERQADRFAIQTQGSDIPLSLAFSKVKTTKNFEPFPGFSSSLHSVGREEYRVNKLRIALSLIIALLGFGLLAIPNHSLARAETTYVSLSGCGENMCSTNCEGEDELKQLISKQNMSYLVLDR